MKRSWPSVTIVMPSYNRYDLARNTLRSIFDQKYPGKLEVMFVDDGSDDDTPRLKDEFPINYFRLERSGWTNPSRPCNVGIRRATGEFLILQGSEMTHAEETIKGFVEALQGRPKDWVFATVYDTDQGGHATGQLSGPSRTSHGWFLCALRTEHLQAIRGFDEDYTEPAYDDADLADRLIKYGLRPTYPHTIFGTHQYHPRNHSSGGTGRMAELWRQKTEAMQRGEIGVERNVDREWGELEPAEGVTR